MRVYRWRCLFLICTLFLGSAGCALESDPAREGADQPRPPVAPPEGETPSAPPSRPETIEDTIQIEGMSESLRMRLFQSPEAFPLAFSTYLPEDMDSDTASSTEGDAVQFTSRFGGVPNPEAGLLFLVHPEGVTRQEALAAAGSAAQGRGEQVEPLADPDSWSLGALRFRGTSGDPRRRITGWVQVGRYQDRWFHFLVYYPAEYGDGMSPRVASILRYWRWESSGQPLQPESSGESG